jgi:hypothetical protein
MENEARYCKDCAYYQELPKGPKGGEYGICGNENHGHNKRSAMNRCCKDFEGNKAADEEPQFIEPPGGLEIPEIIWYLEAKKKELKNAIGSGSLATDAKLKSNIALLNEIIDWIKKETEVC